MNIDCLAIYNYDENIKSLLYQFKGCHDYELDPVFLYRYAFELSIMYHNYVIVPIPSYQEEDEKRGFNHVREIFSLLNLKMMDILVKTANVKQADLSKEERKNISKYLKVKENVDLSGKKVLIVDDVFTTGGTMSAAINLIKGLHPKKIKVLVMSKTINDNYKRTHIV